MDMTNLSADGLRAAFAAHFSYEELTDCDMKRLAMFVMHECAGHNLYGEHTLMWVPSLKKRGLQVLMSTDRKGIVSAFIRVNGTYFKDREAISFNGNGYIGFAGWSDSRNVQPFYRAFARWMNEKRFGTDHVRGAWRAQVGLVDALSGRQISMSKRTIPKGQ